MTNAATLTFKEKAKYWIRLSRLPFHLVAIFPILLGTLYAQKLGAQINWGLTGFTLLAVVMVVVTTHLSGEYYDQKEDSLSLKYGKSNFAGGTSVLQEGNINPEHVRQGSNIVSLFVVAIGLFIYFFYDTGIWTLPLGAFGLAAGYFYSTPPIRFVKLSIGEVMIGLCYGFLTVAVATYLQADYLGWDLIILGLPIAISIFQVILINEFPDYRPDKESGKRNLVVAIGLKAASIIYILMMLAFISSFFLIWQHVIPRSILHYFPMGLSFLLMTAVIFGLQKNPKTREPICGLTIALNLLTNILLIISL